MKILTKRRVTSPRREADGVWTRRCMSAGTVPCWEWFPHNLATLLSWSPAGSTARSIPTSWCSSATSVRCRSAISPRWNSRWTSWAPNGRDSRWTATRVPGFPTVRCSSTRRAMMTGCRTIRWPRPQTPGGKPKCSTSPRRFPGKRSASNSKSNVETWSARSLPTAG